MRCMLLYVFVFLSSWLTCLIFLAHASF
jgi:hypothetical protein